jgi:DNA-directed RNA polymerase subunit RPC12/RpoP
MPINFACPRCARRLSIATRKGGAEIGCPACAQRIIVPMPEPAKPLPGILIEPGPDENLSAQSPETDSPRLIEEPRDDDRREDDRREDEPPARSEPADDYDPYPIRRRRRRQGPNPVVLIGVGILAVVAVWMVVAAFVRHEKIKAASKQPGTVVAAKSDRGRPASPQVVYREPDAADDSPSLIQSVFGSIAGMACTLFCLALYFTPSIVAVARKHNNIAPIFVVNFFLGWALVGWVIALSWAFTDLKHLENRKRSWL